MVAADTTFYTLTHGQSQRAIHKQRRFKINDFSPSPSTPPYNKWSEILGLETNIFGLEMMMKVGIKFLILKFHYIAASDLLSKKICPEKLN